jgi:hypothetical protein
MAKQQTKQANTTVNNTVGAANAETANNGTVLTGQQDTSAAQAQQTFGNAESGYGQAGQTYGDTVTGFNNMAQNGGFTPEDKSAYLSRAANAATSAYSTAADQAERTRAAAGGLGTGGESSQMARQASNAGSQAVEGAQADLNSQINSNKLAGLSGENTAAAGQANVASGEGNLYNTASGTLTTQGQQILQNLGLKYSTDMEGAQILSQLSKNPGAFQTGLGDVTGLISAIGGGSGVKSLSQT